MYNGDDDRWEIEFSHLRFSALDCMNYNLYLYFNYNYYIVIHVFVYQDFFQGKGPCLVYIKDGLVNEQNLM